MDDRFSQVRLVDAQGSLRLRHIRPRAGHIGACPRNRRLLRLELVQGRHLASAEFAHLRQTRQLRLALFQCGFGLQHFCLRRLQRRRGLHHLRLQLGGVDAGENLSDLDLIVVVGVDRFQRAGNFGADLHLVDGFERSRGADGHHQIASLRRTRFVANGSRLVLLVSEKDHGRVSDGGEKDKRDRSNNQFAGHRFVEAQRLGDFFRLLFIGNFHRCFHCPFVSGASGSHPPPRALYRRIKSEVTSASLEASES